MIIITVIIIHIKSIETVDSDKNSQFRQKSNREDFVKKKSFETFLKVFTSLTTLRWHSTDGEQWPPRPYRPWS